MQKDDDLNYAIGKRIKQVRLDRKITQDTLAELIGVCNGQHISNIERGHSGLSIPKLIEVCKALNVTSDYLLFGTSSIDVETELHNYLKLLTGEQASCLLEIMKIYLKSCGHTVNN